MVRGLQLDRQHAPAAALIRQLNQVDQGVDRAARLDTASLVSLPAASPLPSPQLSAIASAMRFASAGSGLNRSIFAPS